MKTKFLVTVILCVISMCRANGQGTSVYSDTLAFRQYLSDNFGTRADKLAIFQLYHRLGLQVTRAEENRVYTETSPIGGDPAVILDAYDRSRRYDPINEGEVSDDIDITKWNSDIPAGHQDNFYFPDSLRKRLRKEIFALGQRKRNKKADQEALIRSLAAFDSVAINKPVFFSEIYGTFKGNYRKYVKHLYKKSILCSSSRMMHFTLHPTAEKLQADLGVQFVIGLALYESWIKDVREGRVMADK